MTLVFVNRFFFPDHSATSQILTDAAFFLADRQHDVLVVTSRLDYESGERKYDPDVQLTDRLTIHRLWTSGFGRFTVLGRSVDYLTFYAGVFLYLLMKVKQGDVIVAKTDPPLLSIPCAMVCYLKKAKLVNWLQDLFPEVATNLGLRIPTPLLSVILWARNKSLRLATVNIALGDVMAERISRIDDNIDVTVNHNWADGEAIAPQATSKLRDSIGLDDCFVVQYSGNLGRAHDIETLLGAARLLRESDVKFLMVGGGALMNELRERVSQEALENFVFHGYVAREHLADSLAAGDVHLVSLQPSLEGLIVPSKIYGILAAGKPTIFVGDPEGQLARILSESDSGVAVSLGDTVRLVEAINKIKNNEAMKRHMGKNARNISNERYSSKQALNNLEDILCCTQ